MVKLTSTSGHHRRAKHAPSLSDPGPCQALTAAAMTAVIPAQPAAARYPRDIARADGGCAPDTGRQAPDDEAEKNACGTRHMTQ